jgi:hypothetical protein
VTDQGKPRFNPIVLALITGNLQAFGVTLQGLDENSTGRDDVVGNFLVAGSEILPAYLQSNDGRLDRALLATYKSIGSYLQARGIAVS